MSETKRQNLPRLWIVATPIGNLGDLSPRAREALQKADAVLCEDTRRTSQLMSALGIRAPLRRMDAHASDAEIRKAVERMEGGETLALVTDAGTPGVSDPAARLVAAARDAGLEVSPVPGASAPATLLSVSGFDETAFVFRGFFPRKKGEREAEVAMARSSEAARVFVWFESPERIPDSLSLIASIDSTARIVAAKELTKIYERLFAGLAPEVAAQVQDEVEREGARGEWCFCARFELSKGSASVDWEKALACLLESGILASDASKKVSQHFGVPKNSVYERALELSGKKTGRGG